MALTRASFSSTERRDQSGEKGPHSGGPGAGSTMAKGNTAGTAPHPAGNSAGTGAQGVPPATHSIAGTTNPQSTGAGQGSVSKGFVA